MAGASLAAAPMGASVYNFLINFLIVHFEGSIFKIDINVFSVNRKLTNRYY
jgi:hypothetical protein